MCQRYAHGYAEINRISQILNPVYRHPKDHDTNRIYVWVRCYNLLFNGQEFVLLEFHVTCP